MNKSLFEMEIKDHDYENSFGEFVYKYLDILLQDKLPEGEEKNIARILLDYQQYFESSFYKSIRLLYRQIIELCIYEELQNTYTLAAIKDSLSNIGMYKNDFFKNYLNISKEKQQEMWLSAKNGFDRKNIFGEEIPEELLINNLVVDGYSRVQELIDKHIKDKELIIYYI